MSRQYKVVYEFNGERGSQTTFAQSAKRAECNIRWNVARKSPGFKVLDVYEVV